MPVKDRFQEFKEASELHQQTVRRDTWSLPTADQLHTYLESEKDNAGESASLAAAGGSDDQMDISDAMQWMDKRVSADVHSLITQRNAHDIDEFMQRVEAEQSALMLLESYVDDLHIKHEHLKVSIGSDAQLTEEVNQIVAAYQKLSEQCRRNLKELQAENEMQEAYAAERHEPDSAVRRIRRAQFLTRDINEAKKVLEDVEARAADMLQLEASIRQLHDMFLDMALLVEQQGEMVDRIEFNIERTAEYVENAAAKLREAVPLVNKYRKKRVMLVCLLIVLASVLAGFFLTATCTYILPCTKLFS